MSETNGNPNPPRKPLSEISHLFLSSIRDRQNNGQAPRPKRVPPAGQRRDESVDMTPEEFAEMVASQQSQPEPASESSPRRRVPIAAVVAPHLNGQQIDRVRHYAASLAGQGQRVGLIIVDASEFRLMCFEHNPHASRHDADPDPRAIQMLDGRRMSESLTELHEDVDRWLLCLPSPRGPEARGLLRRVGHWVMLATCDHDGIVSGYRTLKGLAEVGRPRLSVALLDPESASVAEKVARKLNHVALQFLGWELDADLVPVDAGDYAEHSVLWCRATADKAQLAAAPQWEVLQKFVDQVRGAVSTDEDHHDDEDKLAAALHDVEHAPEIDESPNVEPVASVQPMKLPFSPQMSPAPAPTSEPTPAPMAMPSMSLASADAGVSSVIDLPNGADAPEQIVQAVIGAAGEWLASPVRAPMCASATVAVSRDRHLTLIAALDRGLSQIRQVAQAYRWLNENRQLVSMALPQLAIDANAGVRMTLLVDQSDVSAEMLQPMLESGHVSVRTYRRLRWGPKLGLLLDAA